MLVEPLAAQLNFNLWYAKVFCQSRKQKLYVGTQAKLPINTKFFFLPTQSQITLDFFHAALLDL
jgi:hypothetical protein